MTSNQMLVQTVTGPIPAAALGITMMHEHILCDLRDPLRRRTAPPGPPITMENRFEIHYFQNHHQDNMLLDEDDVALSELRRYREAGGGTLVELSTGGLSPQPERLAALSAASGVPIVMGAGFYTEAYLDDETGRAPVEVLEEIIVTQLESGAWGSSVQAGIIGEIGCSWPLRDVERRCLAAAAKAQQRTGVAISIHPGRHVDAPEEIATLMEAAGADPSRTILCHMDRTLSDERRIMSLLSRGFVLEWDFFGIETSQYWMGEYDLPTDYMRLDLLRRLIDCGYITQLTLSQDICIRTRLTRYGGHGYGHIVRHVIPMMRRRGYGEDDIACLLQRNPARLLGFRDAARMRQVAI